MSDQLPVFPSLRAWSVSTLHVAQAAAAQTDTGDNRNVHQTQRSHNKKGRICFSYAAAFILPFQRARDGNKGKAERTSCWNKPPAQNEMVWATSVGSARKNCVHKNPATWHIKCWGEIISLRTKLNNKKRNEKMPWWNIWKYPLIAAPQESLKCSGWDVQGQE